MLILVLIFNLADTDCDADLIFNHADADAGADPSHYD